MSMNINNVSAVNAYLHAADTGVKKHMSVSKSRNVDKAEFSSAARAASEASMTDYTAKARAAAAKAAESSASDERIAALKASVSSGNYRILSSDIAAAIIGR